MKKDSIQDQWDKAAKAWVDFVRTGKDYYRTELNHPAMLEVLGDIRGRRILDLGCGEGWNTRIVAKKGANVTGVDFSVRLIDYAALQEKKDKLGIDYLVLDACNLHKFKRNSFDIVICFMALQDIDNYQDAIKEVHRVLKKGGRFVFAVPHPCFEKRMDGDKVISGWEHKKKTKDKSDKGAPFLKVDRYFDTCGYTIAWNMKRLTHHFETTSFHRTLSDYADALYKAGLMISRLKEPKPTKRGLAKHPGLKKVLKIPQSIVVEAVKC